MGHPYSLRSSCFVHKCENMIIKYLHQYYFIMYSCLYLPSSNFISTISICANLSLSHDCSSVTIVTECGHSMVDRFVSMPTTIVLISAAYLFTIIIMSLQQAATTSTDVASQCSNLIINKKIFHNQLSPTNQHTLMLLVSCQLKQKETAQSLTKTTTKLTTQASNVHSKVFQVYILCS